MMTQRKTVWAFRVALGVLLITAAGSGRADIIAPVGASARTTWDGTSSGQPQFVSPQYLIDGSGLTGTGFDAVHSYANTSNLFWHSASVSSFTNEWLEFDLGAAYRVTNALIWQLAQQDLTGRGVRFFSILVAGEDRSYTVLSVSNELGQATNRVVAPVQFFPLVADNVRWVRFNIHTNWGTPSYVGLSEVRFEAFPMPSAPTVRIVAPADASASTTWTGTLGFVLPKYMIDGSGLTGTGRAATHTNANSGGLFWHSSTGITVADQWVEFDLGMACDVTNALVWQLAQTNFLTRGVKDFTIRVAGEDHVFSTHSTAQLAIAANIPNEPVQVVPLAANGVRYIRLNIQSNWGASGIVGLSEVRFEILRVSPNTAEWTLPSADAMASSTWDGSMSGRQGYVSPHYLVDGSGLTGSGRSALHVNADATGLFWHSNTNNVIADQWLEFDLGLPYDLRKLLLWQLAQANNTSRGIKTYSIQTAGTNHVFSTIAVSNALKRATGETLEPMQWVALTTEATRYVRLNLHANWGASDVIGLGEIAFEVAGQASKTNGAVRTQVGVQGSSASTGYPASGLTDGTGLIGHGVGATHTNGLGSANMWLSARGAVTNQWLEFDLGRPVELDAAAIWQYNQNTLPDESLALGCLKRGIRWMTVSLADADHVYFEYGKFGLAKGGGSAAEPAQVIGLKTGFVRYVKFAVEGNWGDPYCVGLGEVEFLYTRHDGTVIKVQ